MLGTERHGGAPLAQVWVRRCRDCGTQDLRAGFGQPAVIDPHPWSCPACGSPEWAPVRASVPTDPGAGACPYRIDNHP